MERFEPGKVINTTSGVPATIIKYLAGGGRGDVYLVEFRKARKALMWYRPQVLREPEAIYGNLKRLAEQGPPDQAFLWPDAVTERTEGSFGCIMDLVPEGYYELGRILASNEPSVKAATEACIQITNAFRKLHLHGYCYADMNDGHFLINPKTGDVLICGNDEIVPNGTNVRILQKPRYAAPEIVVSDGKRAPDVQAERYTLSVLIFLILFGCHPLEGRRWLVRCMTSAIEKMLYGTEPVFVFDPDDDSNRPNDRIQVNAINRWNRMPSYVKDMCVKAFCRQSLKEPGSRPTELDWLRVLVRLRSEIVPCDCGGEVFADGANTYQCDCCGKAIAVKNAIVLPEYSVGAVRGACVYRCQIGMCNPDDALKPVLLVVSNSDGVLGVKNMTRTPLRAFAPSGKEKRIEPGAVIPLKSGIVIQIYDKTIKLT